MEPARRQKCGSTRSRDTRDRVLGPWSLVLSPWSARSSLRAHRIGEDGPGTKDGPRTDQGPWTKDQGPKTSRRALLSPPRDVDGGARQRHEHRQPGGDERDEQGRLD